MPRYPVKGEIHYAWFPDEEARRPGVVVSVDSRNEFANSVIVVPVTANLKPGPSHVELPAAEGGLKRDSVARCENIATLPKSWIDEDPVGPPVSLMKMREIERAIMRAIGVPTL